MTLIPGPRPPYPAYDTSMIDHTPTPLHPAQLPPEQLLAACEQTHGRSAGPGGQHRNKVATTVRLLHRPTGVEATARERRSQAQNLSMALFRLRVNLALEHRAAVTLPTELWVGRTRGGKIACNVRHADYPAMLAEALDHVDRHRGDVKKAALVLEVSTTQLVRFLATEPRALDLVNSLRKKRGMNPLKP